jgi:hypothetical protein
MNGAAFFKADPVRVPGGCMDCNAYQTLDTSEVPIFRLSVHHDDTCPTYRAMSAQVEAS